MKCQVLISRKNKKNISKCRLLEFLPSMQRVTSFEKGGKYFWSVISKRNPIILDNFGGNGMWQQEVSIIFIHSAEHEI